MKLNGGTPPQYTQLQYSQLVSTVAKLLLFNVDLPPFLLHFYCGGVPPFYFLRLYLSMQSKIVRYNSLSWIIFCYRYFLFLFLIPWFVSKIFPSSSFDLFNGFFVIWISP